MVSGMDWELNNVDVGSIKVNGLKVIKVDMATGSR